MHISITRNIFMIVCMGMLCHEPLYCAQQNRSFTQRFTADLKHMWSTLDTGCWWTLSFVLFYPTLLYNRRTQHAYSFNKMLEGDASRNKPLITLDENNKIKSIIDIRKAPIYLSGIMQSPEHAKQLRKDAQVGENVKIGMHTLNRWFEQWFVGLKKIVAADKHIKQYEYSTTDYTAPSMVDLIRGIRDLKDRDKNGEIISNVHCKAGKGRSTTLIIAYFIYLAHCAEYKHGNDGKTASKDSFVLPRAPIINDTFVDELIDYAKGIRPIIKINGRQHPRLYELNNVLKKSGDFA